jgi:hypothetical protein
MDSGHAGGSAFGVDGVHRVAGYHLVEASRICGGVGRLVTKPTEVYATKEHVSTEPLNVPGEPGFQSRGAPALLLNHL